MRQPQQFLWWRFSAAAYHDFLNSTLAAKSLRTLETAQRVLAIDDIGLANTGHIFQRHDLVRNAGFMNEINQVFVQRTRAEHHDLSFALLGQPPKHQTHRDHAHARKDKRIEQEGPPDARVKEQQFNQRQQRDAQARHPCVFQRPKMWETVGKITAYITAAKTGEKWGSKYPGSLAACAGESHQAISTISTAEMESRNHHPRTPRWYWENQAAPVD